MRKNEDKDRTKLKNYSFIEKQRNKINFSIEEYFQSFVNRYLHTKLENYSLEKELEKSFCFQKLNDVTFSYNAFIIIKIIIFFAILKNINKLKNKKEENIFFFAIRKIKIGKIKLKSNGFIAVKNESTNTCKNNYNKKYNNSHIIIKIKSKNKNKRFIIGKRNYLRNFIEIIKIIILFNLLNNTLLNNKVRLIEYKSYNITLKIKGIGFKQVFSSNLDFTRNNYPKEVYINGNKQSSVINSYNFTQTDNCIELVWYNLISNLKRMFSGCSDITEIDFSNFDTTQIIQMNYMFYGCSSLTSLNIDNFDTSQVTFIHYMFYNCSSLASLNLSNFDTSKVEKMYYMFYGCSSLTSLNLSHFQTSKVLHIDHMFDGCVNLEYINMINFKENSLEDGFYFDMFKNVPNNIVLCFNKNNIQSKIYPQIENITCHIEYCGDDWKLNKKNLTTILNKNECIKNDINKIDIILDDLFIKYNSNKTNESNNIREDEEINYYNDLIKNIESILTDENFDASNLDKEKIVQTEKMIITLTTTKNGKDNIEDINNNITKLDLGQCEKDLRKVYNLSDDEILYMEKLEIPQPGMKISKVEYRIYSKLNGKNLIRLNISECKNSKISLSIPIQLAGDFDKLNTSSDYFNDPCSTSTSDSGTDISLKDRQKEYVEGNQIVCQEDCKFSYYNSTTQHANCSCDAKESSSNFNEMNIDKNKIYDNFDNSNKKGNTNFVVISCDILGSTENIKSNTGFFLLLIILAIFLIIFILFCSKGYYLLVNKMDKIIYKKFKNESKHKNNKIKKNSKHKKGKENKIVINNQILVNQITSNNKSKKKSKKQKNSDIKKQKSKRAKSIEINKKKSFSSSTEKLPNEIQKTTNKEKSKVYDKLKPDTDYEFNWLSYNDALKYDKRSNCDYYGALIKSKQIFIFTFCSFNDYNSGIIKKFILFLSFALHYTANAFFFTDDNMHQIYEDKGKFNFEYQITNILYSAIISNFVLRIMLQTLVLTDKDILEVKIQETKPLAINMKMKKLKCIKIKYTIFFILNFLLLWLFWYYLTCFNAIFKNTQIYLIENTIISFGFSLLYPFLINIFPTLFRGCAIHSSNKKQECLYKFSQIIQLL